ncbi:MAG: hypothetical protein AB2L14_00650 [Candidatus Xenobiia bacterium LiM19]
MEIALFLLGAVTFIIGLMFISGSSFEKGTWWFFLIGIAFLGISSWSGSLREKIETEKQVARWLPTTCDSIRFDQPVNRKKKEEYLKKLLEEKKLPVEKPLQKLEKALDMRITEIIKRQSASVEAGLSEKDAADRRRIATKLAAKMASDLNDPHFPEPVVLMLCMHNFALSEAASTTEGKTTEAVLDLRYLAGKIVAAAWSEPSSLCCSPYGHGKG